MLYFLSEKVKIFRGTKDWWEDLSRNFEIEENFVKKNVGFENLKILHFHQIFFSNCYWCLLQKFEFQVF